MLMQCPKCHESSIRRSHRRFFDFLRIALGLLPLRCNRCEHRFFRPRKNIAVRSH